MPGARTSDAKQSTTASRSVAAAVQARLTVGRANDSYEREADRSAHEAVDGGSASAAGRGGASGTGVSGISRLVQHRFQRRGTDREEPQAAVQRQDEDQEPAAVLQSQRGTAVEEEEAREGRLQRQPEEDPQMRIQRQMEEEAPQAQVRRQAEEEPQLRIQRQDEEEEVQARLEPRPTRRDKRQFPRIDQIEDTLFDSKGGGEPLPEDTRRSMEASFRADFRGVRIHTGPDAVRMARQLNAQAFTHGRDIYFNSGKYEPDTLRGRELLAHELTHVIQQGAAERHVAPEQVAENNARRNEPMPQPPDREAIEVGEQVEETAEGEADAAAGEGEVTETPPGEPETAPEEAGAEQEEAAAEEEAPGGESASDGPAPPSDSAAPAEEAAADGIGAYLRQSTEEAVASKKRSVKRLAENQKKKEDARIKVAQSEESVEPPAREGASRARAAQVETVEQTPPPDPDEEQAREEFEETLESVVPDTLEAVDKFKEEGRGRIVGEKVKGVVTVETKKVEATYEKIEEPPEPEPPDSSEPLPGVEAAPETPALELGEGVVGEVSPEHTDMSEFEEESDALLEQEGITEEQLGMVDEGDLAEASNERQDLADKVEGAPAEVKAVERQEKERVDQALKAEEQEGRKEMQAERKRELERVRGDQQRTKTEMEVKRQEVTDRITAIYERANTKVQQKLEQLEQRSLNAFDDGQAKATKTFEDNVKSRMQAFKRERYDRIGGGLLWVKDKLLGMDDLPRVKRIFETEKSRFVSAIDRLIDQITADNEEAVQECKDIIAEARAEIEGYLEGLGPELKQTGREAYTEMKGKLDALDQKVNAKAEELQKKLEARREEAIKAIEEKIEKMKEEMSGLVSKIGGLLLDAMLKFFKWVLKKAGFDAEQFVGIIDKGKAVLQKIVKDPIGFLQNLLAGVKGGIQQFMANIRKHLVGGLVDWLTGVMSNLPIELPDKWDLKGVLHLVLQILGLTWQRIRSKLVKRLGERVVTIAETSVDIIRRVVVEGPIALWNMIKEKAAEIKERVMESIRGWAIVQLVKQGIVRLLGMLNPAGAIVQAVLAIYNAVMFFIENWERITNFAKTVVGTIADIAQGKIGVVVQAVENAMAQTIPMILSFIARLLNISGISKAIASTIKKIRRPIDKIVDRAIDKMVTLARKVVAKVKKGAQALKEKGLALIKWWRQKRTFTSKDGGSHRLYFRGEGRRAVLMVASNGPAEVDKFLKKKHDEAGENAEQRAAVKTARDAYAEYQKVEDELQKLEVRKANAEKEQEKRSINNAINREETNLRGALDVFSRALQGLNFELESDAMVKTHVNPTSGSKADSVEARPLTWLPGNTTGSRPAEDPPGWDHAVKVDTDPETRKRRYDWVRGHLLNEQLHGPGRAWNLVPITQKVNAAMRDGPEQAARAGISKKGNILHYRTTVDFHGGDPPISHFPERITVRWGYGDEGSTGPANFTEKDAKEASFTQDPPPEKAADVVYNINDVGRQVVIRQSGVPVRFGRAMTIEQTSERGRFASFEQFESRMTTHLPLYQSANSMADHIEAIRQASTGEGRTLRFDND